MQFAVERARGGAGTLPASGVPATPQRLVRVHSVDRPTLVLGSAQPRATIDTEACDAAGVVVVRRRTGGGAVLLEPERVVWIDIVLPAGDPLWERDVGRAFWWLGDVWTAALTRLSTFSGAAGPLTVHRGGLVSTAWSPLVCFAGLGPGEVSAGQRKVVGMAQRRARAGALFQTAVVRDWDAAAIARLLALPSSDRDALAGELHGAVLPVAPATGAEVESAFLAALEALPE